MKKRIIKLSLILFSCVFVLLLSGCGSSSNSLSANSYTGSNFETSNTIKTTDNDYTVVGVKDFNDGYAWISISQGDNSQYKQACIDTSGKIQFVLDDIIEGNLTIDKIRDYKSRYAVIKDNSNNTYILDTKGNIVSSSINGMYDHIVCYDDGYFLIEKKNPNCNLLLQFGNKQ